MPDLTLERLQLFLLVVMPGIVAIKVHDLFHPPEKRDFGSSVLEAAAVGLFNLGIWVWPLMHINQPGWAQEHQTWYAIWSLCFLVISPAGLAIAYVLVRKTKMVARHLGYPTKTAWDDYFNRRQECWVLFHLKNGKMVGGYFGPNSYVSSFPQPPEIYVEEVYRVGDDGAFIEMVSGTMGMVILPADCERLEFLSVEEVNNGER